MSQFVVCGVVGNQKALLVAGGCPANNASASDCGLDDGDEGAEFALEDGVEVVGAPCGDEAVAVSEFAEDSDVVGVLVLHSVGH